MIQLVFWLIRRQDWPTNCGVVSSSSLALDCSPDRFFFFFPVSFLTDGHREWRSITGQVMHWQDILRLHNFWTVPLFCKLGAADAQQGRPVHRSVAIVVRRRLEPVFDALQKHVFQHFFLDEIHIKQQAASNKQEGE